MARLSIFCGLMLLILSWGTICSSALTPFSLEDKLQELEVRLEAKMGAEIAQLEEKVAQLDEKVKKLEAKLKLNEKLDFKVNDFSGLPKSCQDLRLIGHTLNGFYSVLGSAKIESVYCDFTKLPSEAGFQKWIGYVGVKLAPVKFRVERNSHFATQGTPIPFDLALMNVGNAMDLTTGIFTAPQTGMYHFIFQGMAYLSSSSLDSFHYVLYLNGNVTYSTLVGDLPINIWAYDQYSQIVKKGDKLWLQTEYFGDVPMAKLAAKNSIYNYNYIYNYVNNYNYTYNPSYNYTYNHIYPTFEGYISEEEIGASLS